MNYFPNNSYNLQGKIVGNPQSPQFQQIQFSQNSSKPSYFQSSQIPLIARNNGSIQSVKAPIIPQQQFQQQISHRNTLNSNQSISSFYNTTQNNFDNSLNIYRPPSQDSIKQLFVRPNQQIIQSNQQSGFQPQVYQNFPKVINNLQQPVQNQPSFFQKQQQQQFQVQPSGQFVQSQLVQNSNNQQQRLQTEPSQSQQNQSNNQVVIKKINTKFSNKKKDQNQDLTLKDLEYETITQVIQNKSEEKDLKSLEADKLIYKSIENNEIKMIRSNNENYDNIDNYLNQQNNNQIFLTPSNTRINEQNSKQGSTIKILTPNNKSPSKITIKYSASKRDYSIDQEYQIQNELLQIEHQKHQQSLSLLAETIQSLNQNYELN